MGALARVYATRESQAARPASVPFVLWLAMAVGVLIKGPIILMVVALASLVLSVKERSVRWLRPAADWRAAGLAMLIIAPWFIAIGIDTHGAFFDDAVGGDMLGKVAGAREGHGAPPGTYLVAALLTLWPLAPLAIVAAPAVWRARGEDAVAFLLAWLIPSWLVFEAVPTKLPHYVLPLYPAIALLVAFAAQRGSLLCEGRWRRLALILLPMPAAIIALAIPYATLLYGDRADIAGALLAAAAAGCAFLATLAFARRHFEEGVAGILAASFLLFIGAYGFAIPGLKALSLSPRLVASLAKSPCVPESFAAAGIQ